mgnify:CR=1 FL=1
MARYAVFLRGVNVGGITIRSAELRQAFESLPVSGVKTLLASGNVVCTSGLTADELLDGFLAQLTRRVAEGVGQVVALRGGRLGVPGGRCGVLAELDRRVAVRAAARPAAQSLRRRRRAAVLEHQRPERVGEEDDASHDLKRRNRDLLQ